MLQVLNTSIVAQGKLLNLNRHVGLISTHKLYCFNYTGISTTSTYNCLYQYMFQYYSSERRGLTILA